MDETCCWAYNTLGTIPMETFLFNAEYDPFTEDAQGEHLIDNMLYDQVFECNFR